jgi:hypothetical protein
MRLGVIAENVIERLVLKSNAAPEPLLETQMAFSMARSIMVGVKLGLFEAASGGARSAPEIAKTCSTNPGATEKLLNTLTACGYFKFRNGAYAPTPKTEKWLLRRSPHNLCDKLLFQSFEWDMVEGCEAFVRSGKPMAGHAGIEDEGFWNAYQRGMRNLAGVAASEVTARFPMPPAARDMLDIGGSHGFFSVLLCRKHPDLKSVILDLPDAVKQAAPILAEEKMGAQVTHRPGNALTDELDEGCADIVFMSQLVHHFTDEQNRALMKKISRAFAPRRRLRDAGLDSTQRARRHRPDRGPARPLLRDGERIGHVADGDHAELAQLSRAGPAQAHLAALHAWRCARSGTKSGLVALSQDDTPRIG